MTTPVGVISEVTGSLRSLHRRLLPLHVAVFLQGFILWVPVEKLFMSLCRHRDYAEARGGSL